MYVAPRVYYILLVPPKNFILQLCMLVELHVHAHWAKNDTFVEMNVSLDFYYVKFGAKLTDVIYLGIYLYSVLDVVHVCSKS